MEDTVPLVDTLPGNLVVSEVVVAGGALQAMALVTCEVLSSCSRISGLNRESNSAAMSLPTEF